MDPPWSQRVEPTPLERALQESPDCPVQTFLMAMRRATRIPAPRLSLCSWHTTIGHNWSLCWPQAVWTRLRAGSAWGFYRTAWARALRVKAQRMVLEGLHNLLHQSKLHQWSIRLFCNDIVFFIRCMTFILIKFYHKCAIQ